MKILEICPFSKGVCGVFTRALAESIEFKKLGYEVAIFSSDIEKGTGKRAEKSEEIIEGIKIKRFKARNNILKGLSDNVAYFDFEKEMFQYKPDIIITHLMHPHSAKVCKNLKKLRLQNPQIKILIVPHAPFNVKRRFPLNLATYLWRKVSPLDLSKFDKVISITKWEYPYLMKNGAKKEGITYIPNGLPREFFTQKKIKPKKDVLFLGRIAPVKNLEMLLSVAKMLPKITFSIVGPAEPRYLKKIKPALNNLKNIDLVPPINSLKDKISKIDEHKMFVLPSHREAMPQVILEAMARGKAVISSDTDGGKELINHGINGFLFRRSDSNKLSELISKNIKLNKKISKNAVKTAERFKWEDLIKKYLEIFDR